mgnify:CR=1 FL=1
MTILIIIIIGVIIIAIISLFSDASKSANDATKERRRKLAEKFQKEAEEKEKIEKELEKKEIEKYGSCTKSIKWWFDARTYLIRVYEETKIIRIKDEDYKFSDIIGVDYMDKVQKSGTMTTTTNGKSLAGRALVGGLVAGGLGAAVGAVTAKQQTSYIDNDVHDYVILINTKILSKPLIELRIANNISQVNEIIATLNAVIANNQ